jgi:uncharacterized membrane protein
MEKSRIIIIGIIILSFLAGVYFYPQMPEVVASHWNAQGEVDGYMPKSWGLFLMPLLLVGLFLLFLLIPKIDPLKENIKKFRRYFDGFTALLILFLFYVYLLTIFWNIGSRFNMGQLMIPALGILFYYCGILVENAKRNWFIGIRTPWTLSSETVWDKTHRSNRLSGSLLSQTVNFICDDPCIVSCGLYFNLFLFCLPEGNEYFK